MYRFIYTSLRQMLNFTHLSLVFIYSLLGWIITEMGLAQKGTLSSREIIEYYNMIILFLVMLNSIYFIISHFRETLNNNIKDLIIVRLGKSKYFWGLIAWYMIYVFVFYILPLYLVSLLQQYLKSPININFTDYLFGFFSIFIKIGFWPLLLGIILIVWIKNDLLTLIVWMIVYLIIMGFVFVSEMTQANDGNIFISVSPISIILSLSLLAVFGGVILTHNLTKYNYNEKISDGIFSLLARKVKFELSAFHFKMLGFKTQSLYLILGTLGFVFMVNIINGMNSSTIVITKIFVGVFFPLLFSLNQYNLIAVDIEPGMIVVNILRKNNYDRIVINRWLTMLIPQITFSLLLSFILFSSKDTVNILFLILVLTLNLLFNSLNLFLSVFFKKSGYANFIIGFITYLMLREDIQKTITSNKVLNSMNILGCITSFSNNTPAISHILIPLGISAITIYATMQKLQHLQCNLDNSAV